MMEKQLIDWSKHEYNVKKSDFAEVHELKVPAREMLKVAFVNSCGICAVTGDFGNWVFCRTFNPETDDYIAPFYMAEKARTNSSQVTHEFDLEATKAEIKDRIIEIQIEDGVIVVEDENYLPDYEKPSQRKKDQLSSEGRAEVDWLLCLLNDLDSWDGHYYRSQAEDTLPPHLDSESIIYVQSPTYWFRVVNEAYHEMNRRAKEKLEKQNA